MKNNKLRQISIAFLLITLPLTQVFAQYRQGELRVEITERSLPFVVKEIFNDMYEGALVHQWYATHLVYWMNDVSSGWYSNWYDQPVIAYVYEKANYYEVEFTLEPGELSRALYNRHGYWYETRTKLRGFPAEIQNSIANSKYADWKKSSFIERIETNGWPDPVYRFRMKKGLKSEIIRMDKNGTIIQRKLLKEMSAD